MREVHKLIEGKAPIISGVTVSGGATRRAGHVGPRVGWWCQGDGRRLPSPGTGGRPCSPVPWGWDCSGPQAALGSATADPLPLSSRRKPSRHPPCRGSPTRPSSRAPTRSALTRRAGGRARLGAWTWWTSRATCRGTSTRAPTTRRCRGASSRPLGQGQPPSWAPFASHFVTFLDSLGQNPEAGLAAEGAAPACPLPGTPAAPSPMPAVAPELRPSLLPRPVPSTDGQFQRVPRDQPTRATWFAGTQGPCRRRPPARRPSPEPPGSAAMPAALRRGGPDRTRWRP